MALRLRRGTDAERLLITPLQGELIYTNDTKQLYAGDGTTAGGILVSADAATTLDALNDTDLTGKINGDVLQWNSTSSRWEAASNDGVVEGSNYRINIVGDDSSILLNTSTKKFTGTVVGNDGTILVDAGTNVFDGRLVGNATGDLRGSVFGDDSTVLVDGINSKIVGDINNALVLTEQVTVNSSSASGTVISSNAVTAGGNGPNLDFFGSRVSLDSPIVLEPGDSVIDIAVNGWDGAAQTTAAVIKMGPDKYTGSIASGVMPGRMVFLTYNESGATGIDNAMVFNRFGNLGIGTDAPAEKLDVQGNIVASGTIQPGVYADAAARDTALTAPTAGQMVYITDIAKFQGNTDGTITGWANLN